MRADIGIGITEGFEQTNISTLQLHHAAENDVQQKNRDAKKYQRKQGRSHAYLAQFIADKTVRQLLMTGISAQTAIAPEQGVELTQQFRH